MPKFPERLSGAQLKLIAGVSMLIDHICAILFSYSSAAFMVRLTIGRAAMPIYVFMICDGFFYTRNRKRYALSIFITALISEPIYDLAFYGSFFNARHQNVCFTLLFGLLMLCALNELSLKEKQIFHLPVIALFCFLTYILRFSYDYSAVITFAAIYYLHWKRHYLKGLACGASIAVFQNTPGAFLAAIPISLYNGKRGNISIAAKYFFYIFYPAHLFILYVVSICL